MKRILFRGSLCLAAAILIGAGVMWFLGAQVPPKHTVLLSEQVPAQATEVWAVLSDFERWPQWNLRVRAVERMEDRDGMPVWAVNDEGEIFPSQVLKSLAPTEDSNGSLITRVADAELPFSGTWHWTLEAMPSAQSTRVILQEEGEVPSPFFRFWAYYVFGYETAPRAYLQALAEHFARSAATQD